MSNLSLPETKPAAPGTPGVAVTGNREEASRDDLADEVMTVDNAAIYIPSPGIVKEEDSDLADTEGGDGLEAMAVENGNLVFSIWGTCERRTLHWVGECWRVPGVHYTGTSWLQAMNAVL